MLYISTVCVFVSIYKPTLFPTQSTTVERSISLEIQIYHGRLLGGKIKLVSEANYCLFMALFLLLLQFYLTFATQIPFHQVDLFVRLHFFLSLCCRLYYQGTNAAYFAENRCVYSFRSESTVVDAIFKSPSSNLPWWMGWGTNLSFWDVFFLNYYSANIWFFKHLCKGINKIVRSWK